MSAPSAPRWYAHHRASGFSADPPDPAAVAFHRALPGYAPTPLVDLPTLAADLQVGHVLAKDETSRLGLPAFKALGATWAVHRALTELRSGGGNPGPIAVVTATDGNHGRAVARSARLLGHHATVYVPRGGVHPRAVQAIQDEGATVIEVAGNYDAAVSTAARAAGQDPGAVLVQDTAWEGYEQIPGWIVEGYSTLFREVDDQLADHGLPGPDLVLVPTGVGSLLQAALAHYRGGPVAAAAAVAAVEPVAAACMAPSLIAGRPVTVPTGDTVMSGLNCGTPSSSAWPLIDQGLDAAVTVDDTEAVSAGHDLAALGIPAGPCGAASLAGARTALLGPDADSRRAHLRITRDSVVVLIVTEGAGANPLPEPVPGAA
jgi:diaminopropionate ammonia-lyase